MSLTSAQLEAIAARGNVLVVAGAGTGKTRTLVERCLACLTSETPRASLEEILMVTFSEAAAVEMRQRIRTRLEEELGRQQDAAFWREQLALFDTAHIGTLHSFCLELVRQHFYQLELDPQLAVLAEEEARLLADETLDGLLQKHYAGHGPAAEAVQQLIQAQTQGRDRPIRGLILRVHHYTQTRPDAAGWLRHQLTLLASPQPLAWPGWLSEALADWHQRWLPFLAGRANLNELAARCAALLRQFPVPPTRAEAAAALEAVAGACEECPRGKRKDCYEPLEAFHEEALFLASVASAPAGEVDPLAQDWSWMRPQMTTLLEIVREFTQEFTEAKRELGVVDFHDLEQYALRLLWEASTNEPTPIARQWRQKLRFVFVDEYQDINAAQDQIITALSREGAQANRFLVGDVKQSIYRFRLADPHIFQRYLQAWNSGPVAGGTVVPLVDNFRSRERLLDFINSFFGRLMQPALGGLTYDEQARLRFGAREERVPLSAAQQPAPCVEWHVRLRRKSEPEEDEESEALAEMRDLEEADKEARLVAARLRELKAAHQPIWDETAKQFRPVDWRDIAVLLRSPANKVEAYAKEFARLGVPLQVARGGFYESLEISDLVSLLQLLDNPLQDLPALAVLHSPLAGLTLDELAAIRLTASKCHFWTALIRYRELPGDAAPDAANPGAGTGSARPESGAPALNLATWRRVTAFLERFARWRRLVRQVSLSRCLEAVLAETHYAAWLLTQPRGEQRQANVQRLLGLAQEFDQFQRQGLFRFLRFIEAQQLSEAEPSVPAASDADAVRLMSIHQSKGLEFPVVVVADAGKPFNLADLRAEIILDETYGLCPQIKPPQIRKRYPSLPYWLACRRQRRELLGEELRLLYVAMTRARDLLLVSGTVPPARFESGWKKRANDVEALLGARSYADWLGFWFAQNCDARASRQQGENQWIRWTLHEDADLARARAPAEALELAPAGDAVVWSQLRQRLAWQYSFPAATRQPAKTSVSALRRQAAELGEEVVALVADDVRDSPASADTEGKPHRAEAGQPASSRGTAHHLFLQLVSLDNPGSVASLKQEAERLKACGAMTGEDTAQLDFDGLAAFWNSDLGGRILAHRSLVRRELAFTARLGPHQLAGLIGAAPEPGLEQEFVVVQGVADLVVLLPKEIWLLDFKTDQIGPGGIAGRAESYAPQLRLYAHALTQVYGRRVTERWLYFLAARQAVPIPS